MSRKKRWIGSSAQIRGATVGEVSVGRADRRPISVGGWELPFIEAYEQDGGTMLLVLDRRLGFTIPAAQFDEVARLVANAIAIACGMPSHPTGELNPDEAELYFRHVRHRSLAPRMVTDLIGASWR